MAMVLCVLFGGDLISSLDFSCIGGVPLHLCLGYPKKSFLGSRPRMTYLRPSYTRKKKTIIRFYFIFMNFRTLNSIGLFSRSSKLTLKMSISDFISDSLNLSINSVYLI